MNGKKLGCVNAHVLSAGITNGKRIEFDGTTVGLIRAAVSAGAAAGEIIKANYGGYSEAGMIDYRLVSAPHDTRTGGYWIDRA